MSRYTEEDRIEQNLELLNSSGRDLYVLREHNMPPFLITKFKSEMLSVINVILRTIKGTFDCDNRFTQVSYEKLEKMFPTGCQILSAITNSKDVTVFGEFFDTFRNINAHSIVSERDKKLFDYNYSCLKNIVPFNSRVKYYDDEITVAGWVFIAFLFLRETTLKLVTRGYPTFGLVLKEYDRDRFINEVSHINLEHPIREKKGDSIASAIIGEYDKYVTNNGDLSAILFGNEKYPIYKINYSIKDNNVIVKQSSITKTYYDMDYNLKIEYEKGFIELANMLPPFVILDLLKELGVSTFKESDYYQIIEKKAFGSDEWIYGKLNYPKFYVDKNLNILLLPNTITGVPMISGILSRGINTICLFIESYLYRAMERDPSKEDYSSMKEVLKAMHVDPAIIHEMQYVRNFAAHGYIIDETIYYDNESRKLTANYLVKCIYDLTNYLKERHTKFYMSLMETVTRNLTNVLIRSLFHPAIGPSRYALLNYPNLDTEDLAKKNLAIKRMAFDANRFDCFLDYQGEHIECMRIRRVKLKDLDSPLYFYMNEGDKNRLQEFCQKNNFSYTEEDNRHVVVDGRLNKI